MENKELKKLVRNIGKEFGAKLSETDVQEILKGLEILKNKIKDSEK